MEYQFERQSTAPTARGARRRAVRLFAHGMARPVSNANLERLKARPAALQTFAQGFPSKSTSSVARARWYEGCTTHGAHVTVRDC